MTSPDPGTPGPVSFPQQPGPPARASDADREAAVGILHDAVGRGLLTPEEGNDRVTAAYSARFLHELPRLTADLPPPPPAAPVAPGWRALMVLVWLQVGSALSRSPVRGAPSSPRRLALAALAVVTLLALVGMAAADVVDLDLDLDLDRDRGFDRDDD